MKILVLNGSPHSKGTVAALLEAVVQPLREGHEIEWLDVCSLTMKHCSGCMVCREKNECVLPADDAHRVGAKIREADVLVIGTPTHWGNMSARSSSFSTAMCRFLWARAPAGCRLPARRASAP